MSRSPSLTLSESNPHAVPRWTSPVGARASRFTNDASRLFGEFFDEVAEFGEDQFFHRQANGIL